MNDYSLKLLNVHCASCINKIEKALSKHLKDDDFFINFAQRRIDVSHSIKPKVLIAALSEIGYESKVINTHQDDAEDENREVYIHFKKTADFLFLKFH